MSISSSTLPTFSPPAFKAGLANWSSSDGTSGSDSYAAMSEAAYVPNDSDFSGCLELIKTRSVQKIAGFCQNPDAAGNLSADTHPDQISDRQPACGSDCRMGRQRQ